MGEPAPPVATAALPFPVAERPAEPPAAAPRPAAPLPPATPPSVPEPSPAATAAPPPAVSPAVAAAPAEPKDRVVRVAAQSLTRLMGLAGEALVESRWLHPFTQSLVKLKREQDRLADELNDLIQALPPSDEAAALQTMADDVRQRLTRCREALNARVLEFETHARTADDLNSRLYNEVIASRMRPFGDGVQGFSRMVRDIARQLHKKVRLEIAGEATPVDRDVLEKLDNPLNHLLRNAVDHGIETPEERVAAGKPETALLRLEARHLAGMLAIRISDDGRGIDAERVRQRIVERGLTTADLAARMTETELLEFLYLPGFSTRDHVTELSGRGVGLDVVHNMVHAVGGMVRVQTQLGRGTAFDLQLPITLSVIRAVLVEIAGETYAFPHHRIDRLLRVPQAEISSLEERQYFRVDGHNVGAVLASQVMRLHRVEYSEDLCVILFSSHADRYGLIVDKFLGEQDLVVRPLDPRIGKVPHICAASVLDDGSPVLIADVEDIRRTLERMLDEEPLERTDEEVTGAEQPQPKKRILVVDDSITVREVERQLLATRGYDVTVAVDGADGWNAVRDQRFDLVVSDVDMPRMNGLEFTKRIKADSRLQSIPVVIVSYKDREEDRLRGLDAGANCYLTKSGFHVESLLAAVENLIGAP
jgi:two-component system sensor histidine kinase and response regulator WspE